MCLKFLGGLPPVQISKNTLVLHGILLYAVDEKEEEAEDEDERWSWNG